MVHGVYLVCCVAVIRTVGVMTVLVVEVDPAVLQRIVMLNRVPTYHGADDVRPFSTPRQVIAKPSIPHAGVMYSLRSPCIISTPCVILR